MWRLLLGFALLVGLVAGASVPLVQFWPASWEGAQQATLAAALIGFLGVVFSTSAKWMFDRITVDTRHTLSVREKLLERFFDYSANYLTPIGAAAGEVQSYLYQLRPVESGDALEGQDTVLEGLLFNLGRYFYFQQLLRGNLSLRETARPEGVFLNNRASEELVWGLMVPPWAFGIDSFELLTALIESVTTNDRGRFVDLCRNQRTPERRMLRRVGASVLAGGPRRKEVLLLALDTFIRVLAAEVTEVYGRWYRGAVPYPRAELRQLLALPETEAQQIGILHGISRAVAKQKARRFAAIPFFSR